MSKRFKRARHRRHIRNVKQLKKIIRDKVPEITIHTYDPGWFDVDYDRNLSRYTRSVLELAVLSYNGSDYSITPEQDSKLRVIWVSEESHQWDDEYAMDLTYHLRNYRWKGPVPVYPDPYPDDTD